MDDPVTVVVYRNYKKTIQETPDIDIKYITDMKKKSEMTTETFNDFKMEDEHKQLWWE